MTKDELNEILEKHEKWLNNEEGGERANLRYASLRGADLCEANLIEADLRGANLYYADLRGANLEGADLRRADLHKANLYKANLRYANLHKANLEAANLEEADLCGANLFGANLEDAILPKTESVEKNIEEEKEKIKEYRIWYGANREENYKDAFPDAMTAFEAYKKEREEFGEELEHGDEIAIVSGIAEDGTRVYAFVGAGQGTNILYDDFEDNIANFDFWWEKEWDNTAEVVPNFRDVSKDVGDIFYIVQSSYIIGDDEAVGSPKRFYAGSLEEAEEVYRIECEKGCLVDLLHGTPGHYDTVKKNYDFRDGHFFLNPSEDAVLPKAESEKSETISEQRTTCSKTVKDVSNDIAKILENSGLSNSEIIDAVNDVKMQFVAKEQVAENSR